MVCMLILANVNGKAIPVFDNPSKNSCLAIRPLRYTFEKEDKKTTLKEAKRLLKEMKNAKAKPYK